jgi:hypothetical protein
VAILTNNTPEMRRARAERFRLWMQQDGLEAVLDGLRAQYIGRIAQLDQTDKSFPNAARILASAAKVVDVVRGHIEATIADGQVAAAEIDRTTKLKSLSAEQRRWL